MHERALTAADLDPTGLLVLLEREDATGVLSIFAEVGDDARGTEIDLRNRISELQRRLSATGPGDRATPTYATAARPRPTAGSSSPPSSIRPRSR